MDNTIEAATAKPGNEMVVPTKLTVLTAILATVAFGILYWSAGKIPPQAGTRDLILITITAALQFTESDAFDIPQQYKPRTILESLNPRVLQNPLSCNIGFGYDHKH